MTTHPTAPQAETPQTARRPIACEPASAGRRRRSRAASAVPFAAALALIGVEALLTARGHVLAGEVADAALLLLLAGLWRLPGAHGQLAVWACWALALVALTRLLALGMPLRDASTSLATLVVALLVIAATVAGARAASVPLALLLRVRAKALIALSAGGGLALGLVAHLLGAARLWQPGASARQVLLALLAALFAALAEELLFRGVVQVALTRVALRAGTLMSVALFAASYLDGASAAIVLVVALAGGLFALAAHRARTLLAPAAGHLSFMLGFGVLWPWLLGRAGSAGGRAWVLALLAAALAALGGWVLARGPGGIRLGVAGAPAGRRRPGAQAAVRGRAQDPRSAGS